MHRGTTLYKVTNRNVNHRVTKPPNNSRSENHIRATFFPISQVVVTFFELKTLHVLKCPRNGFTESASRGAASRFRSASSNCRLTSGPWRDYVWKILTSKVPTPGWSALKCRRAQRPRTSISTTLGLLFRGKRSFLPGFNKRQIRHC